MNRYIIFRAVPLFAVAVGSFFVGRMTTQRNERASTGDVRSATPQEERRTDVSLEARAPALTAEGDMRSRSAEFKTKLLRLGNQPSSAARYDEVVGMLQAWMAVDPLSAIDYTRSQFSRDRQEHILPTLLGEWAKKSPAQAWDWVSTKLPGDLTRPTMVDAVLSEIGKSDSALASNFATGFARAHPDEAQSVYVSALRGILYSGNYDAARGLVDKAELPAGSGRYDLTGLIASEWARYDPEKTAVWARSLPAGSEERKQAILGLGQSWAEVDGWRAADFAAQLPPSRERVAMLSTAVDKILTERPAEVGEWLLRYKQHPDFDEVVSAVATAERTVSEHPTLAVGWADTISDDRQRLDALAKIMDRWLTRDSRSAKEFLKASTELPAETRLALSHRLGLSP